MVLEFIQELMQSYPRISVILASLLISFFISLVNYLVLDKEKMHELKRKQKALQEEMKSHKDNPVKIMELQKEMFSDKGESLRNCLILVFIMKAPLILIFPIM